MDECKPLAPGREGPAARRSAPAAPAARADAGARHAAAAGRPVQVDGIKTCVESAYGVSA